MAPKISEVEAQLVAQERAAQKVLRRELRTGTTAAALVSARVEWEKAEAKLTGYRLGRIEGLEQVAKALDGTLRSKGRG